MASNNHQNSRNVIQSVDSLNEYMSPEKEVSKVENNDSDSEPTAADTNSNFIREVEIDPQNFTKIDEDSLPDNNCFGNFTNSGTETYNGDIESVVEELGLDEIEPVSEETIEYVPRRANAARQQRTKNALLLMERPRPSRKNYRVNMIRLLKCCIRDKKLRVRFLFRKYSQRIIQQVTRNQTEREIVAVRELFGFIHSNDDYLLAFSKTDSGPVTDGNSEIQKVFGKNYKKTSGKELSFNNAYCNEIFSDDIVYEAYSLLVGAIFDGKSCAKLCNFFNFSCCRNEAHTENCLKKWKLLSEFTDSNLIFSKPFAR